MSPANAVIKDLETTPIHEWKMEPRDIYHQRYSHADYDYTLLFCEHETSLIIRADAWIEDMSEFFNEFDRARLGKFIMRQLQEYEVQEILQAEQDMIQRAISLFPNVDLDIHTPKNISHIKYVASNDIEDEVARLKEISGNIDWRQASILANWKNREYRRQYEIEVGGKIRFPDNLRQEIDDLNVEL